jgi:hypothetical protein
VRLDAVNNDDLHLSTDLNPKGEVHPCSDISPAGQSSHGLACMGALPPGTSRLLTVAVTAADRVHTGKQHVVVVLTARTVEPARGTATDMTASANFDVELTIFGVDALSPFGVATLFVLPGLLAVIVFLITARVYPGKRLGLPDTVDLKDVRLLPFIVPLSTFAYLLFWLIRGQDLTDSAGTRSVGWLFLLGSGLGLAAGIGLAVTWYAISGRKQFSQNDSPDEVLRRLKARHGSLCLRTIAVDGLTYCYLTAGLDETVLVCPPIAYTFRRGGADHRADFRKAMRADDIGRIRDTSEGGSVALRWTISTGVRTVAASSAAFGDPTCLLEEAAAHAREGLV